MGPRLCSRGESFDEEEESEEAVSQWGHGFVAVERHPICPAPDLGKREGLRAPAHPRGRGRGQCRNGATAL